jgi:excisionase family DNA binding protein
MGTIGRGKGGISMEKPKGVLNINELASYLDILKLTIYKLVLKDKILALKVDRHWRFHKKNL